MLYLLLDLSSPFIPGAFTFDSDESVQVTQRLDRRGGVLPDVAVLARREPIDRHDAHAPSRSPAVARAWLVAASDWVVGLREARFGSYEPPPPAEDH